MSSCLPSLPFFRVAFKELLDENSALLVMARGLGIRVLLCRLIRLYSELGDLVLIVNGLEEAGVICAMLESDGVPPRRMPRVLDSGVSAAERHRVMEAGGAVFVSSQQILVDFLLDRLDAKHVRGIIVCGAHQISEQSKEGFAIRLFQQRHPGGFIKALSDDPESLVAGFGRLEKTMSALHVRRLLLWPRFSQRVREDLDRLPRLTGGEEDIDLSPGQAAVQRSIIAAIDIALTAVRAGGGGAASALSRLDSLFENFDDIIKGALGDAEANTRGAILRALNEIRALRKLLGFCTRYDAVSFYSFLETLRSTAIADGHREDWVLSPRGAAILDAARLRIYRVIPLPASPAATRTLCGLAALRDTGNVEVVERVQVAASSSAGQQRPAASSGAGAGDKVFQLQLVLEHNPKWARLLAIVRECVSIVEAEQREFGDAARADPGSAVLILVRDESTCAQVKALLAIGPDAYLQSRFLSFLRFNARRTRGLRASVDKRFGAWLSNLCAGGAPRDSLPAWLTDEDFLSLSSDEQELVRAADLQGEAAPAGTLPMFVSAEQRLLWKQCARFYFSHKTEDAAVHAQYLEPVEVEEAKNPDDSDGVTSSLKQSSSAVGQPFRASPGLARDVDGGEAANEMLVDVLGVRSARAVTSAPSAKIQQRHRREDLEGSGGAEVIDLSTSQPDAGSAAPAASRAALAESRSSPQASWIPRGAHVSVVAATKMDLIPPLLSDVRPRCVILYDPDAVFTRELEVYAASHLAPSSVSVFTLFHAASSEQARFAGAVRRERDAFVKLIAEKKTLAPAPLPPTADETAAASGDGAALAARRGRDGISEDAWGVALPQRARGGILGGGSVVGGAGGGAGRLLGPGAPAAPLPSIIVDERDFRSKLPSLLNMSGFVVIPATLAVGDYILTPSLCVERKSLVDLTQSLASGRLFRQATAMTRFYSTVALLIEFDQEQPWELAPSAPTPQELGPTDVRSRLIIMLLHFPGLRLLWTRSAHNTVDLFKALKVGAPEPNKETAVGISFEEDADAAGSAPGSNPLVGGFDATLRRDIGNTTACDILRKLPGVTPGNFQAIVNAAPSLAALAKMTVAQLTPLMGVVRAATLFEFMHKQWAPESTETILH